MGTEYWLVDRTGRHALDIDKAYGLAQIAGPLGSLVTPAMVDALEAEKVARFGERGRWLPTAIRLWMERVAEGRPVEPWDDQTDDEWEVWDNGLHAAPGWTLYQTHDLGAHPLPAHMRLWRPPEVLTIKETTP